MTGPKKLFVKSYGCQMNVYDSHRMADTLAPEGYVETAAPDDADLVILNTCHIREKAAEKVYSELGRLRVMKQEASLQGRDIKIAVAGCVAQAEGEEIVRRAPVVDLVVGPQSYHRLPEMLGRIAHLPQPARPVRVGVMDLAQADAGGDAASRRSSRKGSTMKALLLAATSTLALTGFAMAQTSTAPAAPDAE